jgi:hypothetical protein
MTRYTLNIRTGPAKRIRHTDGRDYWVAPIVSICPGVLNGSQGALGYLPEDIIENIGDWNGVPLTNFHPITPLGEHVTANHPGVLERQGIGYIHKTEWDGRLKHEGWFDVVNTLAADKRFGTDIAGKLQRGEPVETSTGLFTFNEPCKDNCQINGRAFTHYARNHRPDHLAILDGQVGACSLADGCGVLVNADDGERWVTTESGNHVLIKDGKVAGGNPHVTAKMKGGGKAKGGKIAEALPGDKVTTRIVKPDQPPPTKEGKAASAKAEAASDQARASSRSYYDRIKDFIGKPLNALREKAHAAAAKVASAAHNVAQSYHQAAADLHSGKSQGDKEWNAYHQQQADEHGAKREMHDRHAEAHMQAAKGKIPTGKLVSANAAGDPDCPT